jgi:hypothetical protein
LNDPLFDKSLDEPLDGKNAVPAEWVERARSELRRGERLTWLGQPRPAHYARQALPAVIFGALWTAFCLFFMTLLILAPFSNMQSTGNPMIGWFIIGVFLLIGLAILSSPYWQWRKAKRTCYALTDRRAILWKAGSFGSVEIRSYEPEDLTGIYRVEYPGGGDLVFEEIHTVRKDNDGEQATVTTQHGFLGIEKVREVEEFLRRTLFKLDT